MKTLVEWLATHGHEAKAKRLTIQGKTYQCAVYMQNGREMLYALGALPKCYIRRSKTVFNFEGDARDWYVCCHTSETCTQEPYKKFHPFGHSFQLAPWESEGGAGPIDAHNYWRGEHKPYTRVSAALV